MQPSLKKLDTTFKAAKAEDGTYDITLSVPTEDRDGEVIDAKAFEPLPDWLNIDIDHGMSVLTTVGSGTPYYDGDTLKLGSFTFASTSLGQEVKTLVDEGHVRKMSVAYMGSKYEDDESDGRPHLRKAELLNAAIVAIPSNREADILAAKAADLHAKASKAASLQNIHDLSVAAGAECKHAPEGEQKTTDTDPEVKDAAAGAATAAPAAAPAPPADVAVARALAELSLAEADLSLS